MEADRPTRQCPDCAETILTEARVCKHCGYRFDLVGAAGALSARLTGEREDAVGRGRQQQAVAH
jgi:Uncharacterised protein family UPF0547